MAGYIKESILKVSIDRVIIFSSILWASPLSAQIQSEKQWEILGAARFCFAHKLVLEEVVRMQEFVLEETTTFNREEGLKALRFGEKGYFYENGKITPFSEAFPSLEEACKHLEIVVRSYIRCISFYKGRHKETRAKEA
ncbi:hypothetical protein F9K88_01980 [Brucella intermedia]|uniref:hypothetical protein n=1 Tax=Brucella intermedia TaxID=94625 RepID=UPI00124BFDB2|nr:hypothetical protein [Brucella intermedia]KAB2714380.1 hypothetical protein F9K88_01980 [Brucella intermedia]